MTFSADEATELVLAVGAAASVALGLLDPLPQARLDAAQLLYGALRP